MANLSIRRERRKPENKGGIEKIKNKPLNKDFCIKKSYATKRGAGNALSNILSKADGKKKPQRFYKCETCGKFHLTSQPKRKYND